MQGAYRPKPVAYKGHNRKNDPVHVTGIKRC